jgi:hypothetical protein
MLRVYQRNCFIMFKKVISGGQTGADRGGLIAAKQFGIPTGGWIPKGCLTENGFEPQLREEFGLKETLEVTYPPRTYANARDSDGTIRFASDWESKGERCTLNGIVKFDKPYVDIDFPNDNWKMDIIEVVDWIKNNHIEILNVAGNREKTAPGIQDFVTRFMTEVFNSL